MHPTTYEALAKSHIRDLQPARTWPTNEDQEDGSAKSQLTTGIRFRFAQGVAAFGRWIRRPASA